MIGKRPHPMIGKLSELLVSGSNRGRFLDVGTSPRSPLDYRIQSPRGLKNYELGGVGLGIVAALEKKSSSNGDQGQRAGHEILAKKCGACSTNLNNRSVPIPVNSGKNCERIGYNKVSTVEDMDMDSLENYTYVISHGPGQKSFTKVYYDGQEYGEVGHDQGFSFDVKSNNLSAVFTLKESPARVVEDIQEYPTSDFLSSCYLCRKKLHGRDIYMYRGEKAFCSVECRSSHMMVDERKEKQCRAEVTRSADVAGSSYTRSPIFSAGIVAI